MEFSVTEQDDERFLLVGFVSIRCKLALYVAVNSEWNVAQDINIAWRQRLYVNEVRDPN